MTTVLSCNPKFIFTSLYLYLLLTPYPCEVHAQFELGEQVENDAPLVIQDAQVLFFVVLCIRHLFSGADVF